jgi:hypothetical protein
MSKKTIYTMAAMALLAVPAMASAQSTVTANATVAAYTDVAGTSSIEFGTLSTTADNTIDPAGGVNSASRTVSFNKNITVTYSAVATNLTATINGSTANLPIALTCASKAGTAAWSAAAPCSSASFDLDVGTGLTSATLGFGGKITAADAAAALAGTYTGTLTVVVTTR